MKTTDALRDFVEKDGRKFAVIERQFGWRKNTLNRILVRKQPYRDPILSNIQEFLRNKGYVLDELKDLPEYILTLREMIFTKKRIEIDELSKKLGYLNVSNVYSIFRGERISNPKHDLILEILKEVSKPQQRTVKRTIETPVRKEKEAASIVLDQDSALTHINYAVFLLLQYGEDFLKRSSKEQRVNLRKVVGQSRLFDATSIMAALNSEKANQRRSEGKQCLD